MKALEDLLILGTQAAWYRDTIKQISLYISESRTQKKNLKTYYVSSEFSRTKKTPKFN